jgi:hypothetical protein
MRLRDITTTMAPETPDVLDPKRHSHVGLLVVLFERLGDGSLLVWTPSMLVEPTVVSPWSSATWRNTVISQFAAGVGVPQWRVARDLEHAEILALARSAS